MVVYSDMARIQITLSWIPGHGYIAENEIAEKGSIPKWPVQFHYDIWRQQMQWKLTKIKTDEFQKPIIVHDNYDFNQSETRAKPNYLPT